MLVAAESVTTTMKHDGVDVDLTGEGFQAIINYFDTDVMELFDPTHTVTVVVSELAPKNASPTPIWCVGWVRQAATKREERSSGPIRVLDIPVSCGPRGFEP